MCAMTRWVGRWDEAETRPTVRIEPWVRATLETMMVLHMSMRSINVTELKANLRKYLRLASRGTRIVVNDRDEPVAELGPPQPDTAPWHERLACQGRLRPGTQDWSSRRVTKPRRAIDIQASLRAVRGSE
jgi:antitoxin (DNA-binding transcriptional repressor) of toxin-antitoxin stability system